jgi:D-arabinose 1-dehydrogenase-like Zn-dependent alcohol dehydrogenase
MLDLAVAKGVKPWVQKYNMDDINKAVKDMKAGKARYRFVLVNTDNGGVL